MTVRRRAAVAALLGTAVLLVGACGATSGRIEAAGPPVPAAGADAGDLDAGTGDEPERDPGAVDRGVDEGDGGEVTVDGSLPELVDGEDDPAVGELLPILRGPGLDGGVVEVHPADGPQFVVFVAHWCPHCQREVPQLVRLMREGVIPSDITVTAVSTAVDERRGNFPPASWLDEEAWPTRALADDDQYRAATAFGVTGFPFLVAVDADGRVVARTTGELDEDDYERLVDLVSAV